MSSFALYMIGFVIMILGLAYLAHILRIPQVYIVAGAVILLGIGILTGASKTRRRDPSEND